MSNSAIATNSATSERTGVSGGGGSTTTQSSSAATAVAAHIAPIIEPPASFGIVAPNIYRCSASSLIQGLSAAPRKETKPKSATGSSVSSTSGSANASQTTLAGISSSVSMTAAAAAASAAATPTESFLSSLQLKTILLLAPEKRPASLTSWCTNNQVQLIHLGLGALAHTEEQSGEAGDKTNKERDRLHPSLSLQKSSDSYGGLPDSGILSLERIVKDSLEILLHRNRLPCLVCDTSGVNETGVVVGCLRRMQRRSFASIRYEYRSFAGSRSRSSHERFIEMFDPDLISLCSRDKLPIWFVQQQIDDEEQETRIDGNL